MKLLYKVSSTTGGQLDIEILVLIQEKYTKYLKQIMFGDLVCSNWISRRKIIRKRTLWQTLRAHTDNKTNKVFKKS